MKKDGTVRLKLTASSDTKLISWILSFEHETMAVKPKGLVFDEEIEFKKLYKTVTKEKGRKTQRKLK